MTAKVLATPGIEKMIMLMTVVWGEGTHAQFDRKIMIGGAVSQDYHMCLQCVSGTLVERLDPFEQAEDTKGPKCSQELQWSIKLLEEADYAHSDDNEVKYVPARAPE